MAIWQVCFYLVNDEVKNNNLKYSSLKFLDVLNTTFCKKKSWCKLIEQFGNLDSTCFEFILNGDDVVEEISLRIDLRNITKAQLQIICAFAQKNNLYIEFEGELYDTTINKLITIVCTSNSYKFMQDPKEFLENLGK